jgi:hypothetical protein
VGTFTRKFMGAHDRISTRFGEAQADIAGAQLEAAEARQREVRRCPVVVVAARVYWAGAGGGAE